MTNILQPHYQGFQFQHTSCAFCGLTSIAAKFMFCSKCRVVVYCSKEHQINHWKRHRRFCKEHVWKKENPYGVAASTSCRVSSCACKNWYHNADKDDSQDHINGYNNTAPSLSSTSTPLPCEDGKAQNQFPFVPNHSSIAPSSLFTGDLSEPNESLRVNEVNGAGAKTTYAFSHNPLVNGIIDDITYPSIGVVGSSNTIVNQLSLTTGSAFDETASLLTSKNHTLSLPPFPPVPPSVRVEDLENHAPAVVHALINNKNTQQESYTELSSQYPARAIFNQSYGQTPGKNGIGNSPVFADLSLESSGSKVVSLQSSSGSTSLPLSLSEASKPFVQEENASVISEVDNNSQELSMTHSSATIPFQHRNNMQYISGQPVQQTRLWINQVWEQVIEDMNRYGVCVVDNLLGELRGSAVCREVQNMYSKGAFQDGQLVKSKDGQSKSIRGDKITWVDGSEPYCRNISVLIKLLDNIVMGANNRNNNGKLGMLKIKERSKAMVACYPGSGSHYVKHVDNPNDDGRCVTAIYYLNKDWNTQENGGLLRIFPEGWSHQVADIEPLFDRVIFFWSDRRNPHEVQPAYKTRYAITLWYFDSNAKARAKKLAESEISSALKSS